MSCGNEGVDEVGRKTDVVGRSALIPFVPTSRIYPPSADGTPGIAPSPLRYSIKRPCAATNSFALTFFQQWRSSVLQTASIPCENPSVCW
jgi:hypothetical protein